MDTIYIKKDKYEGVTLESGTSTPDPPNHNKVIDSDDEKETTEKLLEDYYKAKIDHNHPIFHMIWEIVKEERKALHASIHLFNKSMISYSSINHLFIAKISGSEIRQIIDRDTSENTPLKSIMINLPIKS